MPPSLSRRTKIVCTIGPAVSSEAALEQLIVAGMNVARLNFSHGDHASHGAVIESLRRISTRLGHPVAILQDLPGPKLRTGPLRDVTVELDEGNEFSLTTQPRVGDEHGVSITAGSLPRDVKPGDAIFLADGSIKLEVVTSTDSEIRCKIVAGGTLGAAKGINVPGVPLSVPSTTEEDWKHLAFGLGQGVDMVALSFVREAGDIDKARDFIRRKGHDTPIIAKIEKKEALERIDEIIGAADGVMVARGDLGVEVPIEKVPLAQKEIIRKCNSAGKPVIVATQMLESMIGAPSPTRAEVTDVANAIIDGADAVMLSAETAIGRYPLQSVRMMVRIAHEVDASLPPEGFLFRREATPEPKIDDAISRAACQSAFHLGAAAIVAFTSSGATACRVAKHRPPAPILALTPNPATARRLALSWGVSPHVVAEPDNADAMFALANRMAHDLGLAASGGTIVITAGVPVGVSGSTNLLKMEKIP
ncbi:MAG: pyruvate kinase [Chloroflexi bacterium]|nr:pyruvate kinase [Chloroflexota bacterium]